MLSRVADSLYWMSRYLERAENTVRQLDVTMGRLGWNGMAIWRQWLISWSSITSTTPR